MTLGFDPTKNHYGGTFIGSMMTNIWPYHGVLDETGKRLPLESEGSKFVGREFASIATPLKSSTKKTGCLPVSIKATKAFGCRSCLGIILVIKVKVRKRRNSNVFVS